MGILNTELNSGSAASVSPSVAPPVVWWLRLEAGAIAAVAVILYARTGANWWLFAALWITPDLSMLGYLIDARVGAFCYNLVHSYLLPAGLAMAGLLAHRMELLPLALIWFNHLGVDRLAGFGLKYPTSFGATHLSGLKR